MKTQLITVPFKKLNEVLGLPEGTFVVGVSENFDNLQIKVVTDANEVHEFSLKIEDDIKLIGEAFNDVPSRPGRLRQRALIWNACNDHQRPDPTFLDDFTTPLKIQNLPCGCQAYTCEAFNEDDEEMKQIYQIEDASLCMFDMMSDGNSHWIRWPSGSLKEFQSKKKEFIKQKAELTVSRETTVIPQPPHPGFDVKLPDKNA